MRHTLLLSLFSKWHLIRTQCHILRNRLGDDLYSSWWRDCGADDALQCVLALMMISCIFPWYSLKIPPAGFTLKIWACYVAPGLRLFSPGQDTDSIPFRVCQCFTVVLGVVVSTSAPYFGAPCWVCSFKVWIFCCTFVLGWYSLVHFMSKITLIVQNHSCYCWNCSRFQLGGWSLSSWPQLDHPKIYFGESLFTLSLSDRSVFAVGPFCCLWFLQLPVSFHTALIHRVLRLNLPLSEVGNVVLPQVVYLPCVGTFTFAIVLYLLIHVLLGALWLHCVDGLEPRLLMTLKSGWN